MRAILYIISLLGLTGCSFSVQNDYKEKIYVSGEEVEVGACVSQWDVLLGLGGVSITDKDGEALNKDNKESYDVSDYSVSIKGVVVESEKPCEATDDTKASQEEKEKKATKIETTVEAAVQKAERVAAQAVKVATQKAVEKKVVACQGPSVTTTNPKTGEKTVRCTTIGEAGVKISSKKKEDKKEDKKDDEDDEEWSLFSPSTW